MAKFQWPETCASLWADTVQDGKEWKEKAQVCVLFTFTRSFIKRHNLQQNLHVSTLRWNIFKSQVLYKEFMNFSFHILISIELCTCFFSRLFLICLAKCRHTRPEIVKWKLNGIRSYRGSELFFLSLVK